jgi:hypothetical protein
VAVVSPTGGSTEPKADMNVLGKTKFFDGIHSWSGSSEEDRILRCNPEWVWVSWRRENSTMEPRAGMDVLKRKEFSHGTYRSLDTLGKRKVPCPAGMRTPITIFEDKSILTTFINSLLNSADYQFRAHFSLLVTKPAVCHTLLPCSRDSHNSTDYLHKQY